MSILFPGYIRYVHTCFTSSPQQCNDAGAGHSNWMPSAVGSSAGVGPTGGEIGFRAATGRAVGQSCRTVTLFWEN